MKKVSKFLFAALILSTVLVSCKKDAKSVIFGNGMAPVLSSSVAGGISLNFLNASKEAIKLSWTNPEYRLNTGISSYDVSYQVEIDTAGSNFTNPDKKVINISKDLNISITQNDFNDYLLNQLKLAPTISHNIEIRVKCFLVVNTGILYSNVLKFTATPYSIPPKIAPPSSGTLFITGNAVPSDWTNSPPAAQKFTKISATLYRLDNIPLIGSNSYTFLSTFGSWDDKYSIAVKNDPNEVYGGDFQWQGNDILAPPLSGNYKIEVDFQRGKFTVTKL